MKSFRKQPWCYFSPLVTVVALGAPALWYTTAENAVSASKIEQALYRLMPLPAGNVLARRPPSESRAELDSLIKQTPRDGELYAIQALEDERQFDFRAAEAAWRHAVELSRNKTLALESLADFYARRLQPRQEVETLLRAAALPPTKTDSYGPATDQSAWHDYQRALSVVNVSKLPIATRNQVYEAWIARYPKQTAPLLQYFQAAVDDKNRDAAQSLAARIHSAFPNDLRLSLEADSKVAEMSGGGAAALQVYDKSFTPLWPADLRQNYYTLLSNQHQLRNFLANARQSAAANPAALDPALRSFFYYEQQGKKDLAARQLFEWQNRRATAKSPISADELKTLGSLFVRVGEYDEAAHAYYTLYELPVGAPADKELALKSLADLLLDVPDQPIRFGSRDLSLYRNAAMIDPHPGFLNGILSLLFNNSFPQYQYDSASQTSVAYFHRAAASALIHRFKTEFPSSPQLPACEAKLFAAYAFYGQTEAITRLVPAWLAANKNIPEYTNTALLLADSYVQTKDTAKEFAIYDELLFKLGADSGHRPIGEAPGQANPRAVRSPDYARVLDLYVSRLTQMHRLTDAITLYRREIDRNPDDPGIYQRLALFVEQNHLDSHLEETYRAAMKRFDSTDWPDKLARLYLRKRQTAAYVSLLQDVTNRFDGSRLAEFISKVRPDQRFSPTLYRQINLYAHQRFPHNLTFVRNLLIAYQTKGFVDNDAYEKLLRESWLNDDSLRQQFFQYLSRTGKLASELAALPKIDEAIQVKNTAAVAFYAEGKAWLSHFEESAPAFVALADMCPGDASTNRAISIQRSLAPLSPGSFDTAVRLAERDAAARPASAEAATLSGEIYADRDLYSKAAPWWNRVAAMTPGSPDGYLNSSTVFWDYFQFNDALRVISQARQRTAQPTLFAYQAGVIHENQNDLPAAIDEYIRATENAKPIRATEPSEEGESNETPNHESFDDSSLAQDRLLTLAKRPATAAMIESKTTSLVAGPAFTESAFALRLALLEDQKRRNEIESLLSTSLAKISDLQQVSTIHETADRLGFDDISADALQRTIALTSDPVEKLASRIELAKFYESHQAVPKAENECSGLLKENPSILGVIRANTDFYWTQKQPAKAVATLEAAAAIAQAPYNIQFHREAAQKATESADYPTAHRILDQLLTADPLNADIVAAKAAAYARAGDNNSLLDFYSRQIIQMKALQMSASEKTVRIALLRRGYLKALITAKQFQSAFDQYQALLTTYPEDDALAREVAAFCESNHFADAMLKYYEKATVNSPRDYRWPLVLSRLNAALRRYPESLAALDQAVYVRPDRLDFLQTKADMETRLLRFEAAIKTNQKLYEVSYHDSRYLAEQATLQARLGHKSDAVALLKSAYLDPKLPDLGGFLTIMQQLIDWKMYSEADQIYQQAKPLITTESGDYQRAATLEARTLVALHRPVDALKAVADLHQTISGSWDCQQQADVVGSMVSELYTPEEKAKFAAALEAPSAIPVVFNIYDLARASGFTELAAKRLYRSAQSKPQELWRTLEELQTSRLQYGELGHQLEAISRPASRVSDIDSLMRAVVTAYQNAGAVDDQLRLLNWLDPSTQAELLSRTNDGLLSAIRRTSAGNGKLADSLVRESFNILPEDQVFAAISARGEKLSPLWNHSYAALAAVYYSSPKAQPEFDATLGPRTVGEELNKNNWALHGDVWFYYAARYGEYLYRGSQASAADLLIAPVEGSAAASDSYVSLASNYRSLKNWQAALAAYDKALEIAPNRIDVQVLMAETERSMGRRDQAVEHLRAALRACAARPKECKDEISQVLLRMNQYGFASELRSDVDAAFAASIKTSDDTVDFVSGILMNAKDSKAAIAWLLDLGQKFHLTNLPEQMLASGALNEADKDLVYQANLAQYRLSDGNSKERLHSAIVDYAKYLDSEHKPQDAWRILAQIALSERPADLMLRLATLTGHLAEITTQFDDGTLAPPSGEQILAIATELKTDHPDLALRLREYEYTHELRNASPPAASYFGLAQVRIEQKRQGEAIAIIRDVTLSVGAAFENLPAAVSLLDGANMRAEALTYAREWHTAQPWDSEASLAVARLSSDTSAIEQIRASEDATYQLRAKAAELLRAANLPAQGTTELALLTHQSISLDEADQPFFVRARLLAAGLSSDSAVKTKLYRQAIAINPSLSTARLHLAESALRSGEDSFGQAAWNSHMSHPPNLSWLRIPPVPEQTPSSADVARVGKLLAASLEKRQKSNYALAVYNQLLTLRDLPDRADLQKLRDACDAAARLDQLNRLHQPVISDQLNQQVIVRPKLNSLPTGDEE